MKIKIAEYLKDLKSSSFLYVPNPGNAGDSVITSATYQMFDKLNLGYEIAPRNNFDFSKKTVIYGGGGNLVKLTTVSSRFISEHHNRVKRLIILPHSIKEVDSLLHEFGNNVDIFCREKASFDYVSANCSRANIYMADDMALALDVSDVISSNTYENPSSLMKYLSDRFVRNRRIETFLAFAKSQWIDGIRRRIRKSFVNGHLYCFRGDGEASGKVNIPPTNIDLPLLLAFGSERREASFFSTYQVLTILDEVEAIHTDRLHMAISGALLGKAVYFYDNNYHKCREVFRFSMRERFPNVVWCGED
jgi:exopolysaccharide biosynthesis predicted pyruvyltransferase EpsI